MECSSCGLAPCDLPDGVDPEVIFDRDAEGEIKCEGCLSGGGVFPCSPW